MPEQPNRLKLSQAQVVLMHEVLNGRSPSLRRLAERVGRCEVVSDAEAEGLVDALASAMLEEEYDDDLGLSARGCAIDDMIGIVRQMSEDFYR